MLQIYKAVISDLIEYLINGVHMSNIATNYSTISQSFGSTNITNQRFKFIRKYEDVNTINDSTTVPVLLVTQPDMFHKGQILFNNKFIDLKSILISDSPTRKIQFYVVPTVTGIVGGSTLGDVEFDLRVYYVCDYDIYGFMSKEIDNILMNHYYKPTHGDYYGVNTPITQLWFKPTNQELPVPNNDSILNRIVQKHQIKYCKLI
jgi:hypothetical protein